VYSKKYKEIHTSVKKRDEYRCGLCRKYTRRGQVHHIYRYADNVILREHERNLIYLCYSCHNKIKDKEEYYAPMLMDRVREKYR
jgi:5-methylcytosine-specific restriction endonuclease McrA